MDQAAKNPSKKKMKIIHNVCMCPLPFSCKVTHTKIKFFLKKYILLTANAPFDCKPASLTPLPPTVKEKYRE